MLHGPPPRPFEFAIVYDVDAIRFERAHVTAPELTEDSPEGPLEGPLEVSLQSKIEGYVKCACPSPSTEKRQSFVPESMS